MVDDGSNETVETKSGPRTKVKYTASSGRLKFQFAVEHLCDSSVSLVWPICDGKAYACHHSDFVPFFSPANSMFSSIMLI